MDCKWKISVPNGNKIRLYFEEFLLYDPSSKCLCDYVEIINGDGSLYGIYCAGPGKIPTYIDSKDSEFMIRFRTDCFTNQHVNLTTELAMTSGGRLLFSYQSILDKDLKKINKADTSSEGSLISDEECFVHGHTYSGDNNQKELCENWDSLVSQRYHSTNYRQWGLEDNNYCRFPVQKFLGENPVGTEFPFCVAKVNGSETIKICDDIQPCKYKSCWYQTGEHDNFQCKTGNCLPW